MTGSGADRGDGKCARDMRCTNAPAELGLDQAATQESTAQGWQMRNGTMFE